MLTAIGILSPVTISTHRQAGWHATGVVYLAPVTVLNVRNVKNGFTMVVLTFQPILFYIWKKLKIFTISVKNVC